MKTVKNVKERENDPERLLRASVYSDGDGDTADYALSDCHDHCTTRKLNVKHVMELGSRND